MLQECGRGIARGLPRMMGWASVLTGTAEEFLLQAGGVNAEPEENAAFPAAAAVPGVAPGRGSNLVGKEGDVTHDA